MERIYRLSQVLKNSGIQILFFKKTRPRQGVMGVEQGAVMDNKLIEAVEHLFTKFGIAVDWSKDNILPYITELYERVVSRGIILSIFGVITALAMVIIPALVFKKIYRDSLGEENTLLWDDWGETPSILGWMAIVLGGLCLGIGIFLFIDSLVNLIDWITIPEVAFFEKIMEMAGSNNG